MSITHTHTEEIQLTSGRTTLAIYGSKDRIVDRDINSHGGGVGDREFYEQDTDAAAVPPASAIDAIPDGGYGWVVVFSCSLVTFLFNGWIGAWGVVQTALLQTHMSRVSASTLSFVCSVGIALAVGLGLFSNRLASMIGARNAMLLGVVLVGFGILFSSFTVDNLGGLFVTASVAFGLGNSLLYTLSNTLPVQWFSSKLGTANGLVKLGGGIGATVMAVAVQAALDKVGVAWTFRILGLMSLVTGIPAALLVRERHSNITSRASFVDWTLFKNLPFVCLFLAGAIGTFALFVPPFFLPLFAHSIGLSASTGAAIVAAFNACTAVGRFMAGFACDRYGSTNMLLATMSLNAISMLAIWPVSSTLPPLIIFAAINGVANGAFFVTMPTAVASMIGPGRAAVAMGMAVTGWTGGYLMGSPIAGFLIAATGAESANSADPYRAAIFYAGGVALASAAFVLIARLSMDGKILKKL